VFALKPAPVRVSWLGYFGTTGLNAIDYLLIDGIETPTGDER
jgi:protein O-GlcNAc transferase